MVVGPGSAAFEVIRDLVNHLAIMTTPRWVRSRSQPIALGDLIEYLCAVAEVAEANLAGAAGPDFRPEAPNVYRRTSPGEPVTALRPSVVR